MFIHELQGTSWINHPFWKTKFVLRDEADLQRLLLSPVTHVVINLDQGFDVLAPAEEAPDQQPEPAPTPASPPPPSPPSVEPVAFDTEMQAAHELKSRAKAQITALFDDVRLGKAVTPAVLGPLVEDISSSVSRNPDAFISLSRLRHQDDYTYMHSVTVCALMISLGRQLGFDGDALRDIGMAGLLHDVGKAGIPLEILNKPGKLTDEEFTTIKQHPRLGHQMLDAGGASALAKDVVLHHHERYDGRGYPNGLQGESISLHARMGAVCDVYDAITSNRPYKQGWDPAESIRHMATWAQEGHFDMRVFQAFVKTLGIYPTGTLVRLQSGHLAVVLDQAPGSALKPRVKVFYVVASHQRLTPRMLDLSDASCTDKIVTKESPEDWRLTPQDVIALWAGPDAVNG